MFTKIVPGYSMFIIFLEITPFQAQNTRISPTGIREPTHGPDRLSKPSSIYGGVYGMGVHIFQIHFAHCNTPVCAIVRTVVDCGGNVFPGSADIDGW